MIRAAKSAFGSIFARPGNRRVTVKYLVAIGSPAEDTVGELIAGLGTRA